MILRFIVGVLVGGLLGFGMYHFIGCSSGACPMATNPWVSIVFGMVFGGLLERPPFGWTGCRVN